MDSQRENEYRGRILLPNKVNRQVPKQTKQNKTSMRKIEMIFTSYLSIVI